MTKNQVADFFSTGVKPVYLLSALCEAMTSSLTLHTVVVSSLICSRIEPGHEEVAFVLGGKSGFLTKLRQQKSFSVNLLSASSAEEAHFSSSPRSKQGRKLPQDGWSVVDGWSEHNDSVALLRGQLVDEIARGENSVLFAKVLETQIRKPNLSVMHYGWRKFRNLEQDAESRV